jgi:HlyD family secretion protein
VAEAKAIFRKVALDRLSSPEQLDTVMQITRPRSWIALGGLLLLLVTVGIWGFFGSIPTKVQAQGVLIKQGGVFDAFSSGPGPIKEILVAEGDVIEKGQVVARIDRVDLTDQIAAVRAELAERNDQHQRITSYASQDMTLRNDSLALQESKITDTIAFAEERAKALEQQLQSLETLLEKGLITKQTVLQVQQEYFGTKDLIARSRNELKQIPLQRLSATTDKEQETVRSQIAINETRRRIEGLEQQHRILSIITSPYSGRILEVKKKPGDMIAAGTPIVSLQLAGSDAEGLQAVIYVPPTAGKNVVPGLQVEISPTTAPRAEFGYMPGKVTSVSEFPATAEGMMRVLSNQGLVQTLSAEGPPFAVYADLQVDRSSASGYKWSSPRGGALAVNSGTLCLVTVTVRSRRPIEMVIPILREKTGL